MFRYIFNYHMGYQKISLVFEGLILKTDIKQEGEQLESESYEHVNTIGNTI